MNDPNLQRVQSDLAAMKLAMGGLAYGPADVRFFLAGAAAAAIFTVCHYLGAQSGWPLALAAAPVALVTIAYFAYLATSALGKTSTTPVIRTEHRLSLVLAVVAAVVAFAAKKWAASAGMSHLQSGGLIAIVCGVAFLFIGAANAAPHRYPRASWWAIGIPLIAAGVVVPFVSGVQAITIVGAMAAVMFALCAAAIHVALRRQQ